MSDYKNLFRRLRPDLSNGSVTLISPAATAKVPMPPTPSLPPQPQELGVKVATGEEREKGREVVETVKA